MHRAAPKQSGRDLQRAGDDFGNAVAKIGVNGVLLALDARASSGSGGRKLWRMLIRSIPF